MRSAFQFVVFAGFIFFAAYYYGNVDPEQTQSSLTLALPPQTASFRDDFLGQEISFEIAVSSEKKEVEVRALGHQAFKQTPQLKLSLIPRSSSRNDSAFIVAMQPREQNRPQAQNLFVGRLEDWNESYQGFVLEFRVGRGPWKRFERNFESAQEITLLF